MPYANPYLQVPPERMHQADLGVFKSLLKWSFQLLELGLREEAEDHYPGNQNAQNKYFGTRLKAMRSLISSRLASMTKFGSEMKIFTNFNPDLSFYKAWEFRHLMRQFLFTLKDIFEDERVIESFVVFSDWYLIARKGLVTEEDLRKMISLNAR